MKYNLELQHGDLPADESRSSLNRSRIGSSNSKFLGVLVGILLVMILAGGIIYFLSRRPVGEEMISLQLKVIDLEQKIAELERHLGEHTVEKGETLYRISRNFGISVEELRKLNNLSEDQPIYTGQKLRISP